MSVGELVELLPSPSALIPAALKVNNKIPMIAIDPKNKAAFNSDAGWLIFLMVLMENGKQKLISILIT